jgi:ABC-type polysaccharide/polyol phosphate transport system ATPase subunit
MTQAPIIKVEDVWKRYKQNEQQPSLRHDAIRIVKNWIGRQTQKEEHPFWALQGISFTVNRGEILGIIGRNGSGKTTLLRLLSGITSPTQGTIEITGKFASLIGLGAGFDYERSGRENIFLNAAVYGTPPNQTRELLPEIVDFADLGDFIHIPVKRYSSGMGARLAFSIAIHILPEIIFLDEVLAVGDAAFQQKCFHRILEVSESGRTILFVSHGAASIRQLCDRVLWLDKGKQMGIGGMEILDEYEAYATNAEAEKSI